MQHAGFQHRALVYEGADEYLAGTIPFLWAALEDGEPVLVAAGGAQADLLMRELGGEARWVQFVAIEEVGRNPAAIIPLWRSFVDENGGGPVRGIGEPLWRGRSAAAIDECHRQESLLPLVFADDPAFSLLCAFDAASLPADTAARVAGSHRCVERRGQVEESTGSDPAADFLAGELPPPGAAADTFDFGLAELSEVRSRAAAAGARSGLDPPEVADLVTAAAELAANSVMHGGGRGTLRVWCENGTLLVEVEDSGLIEDPLVGRRRPLITQEGGRGLWLANRLCDLVQIRSGEQGTAVRLHVPARDRKAGRSRRGTPSQAGGSRAATRTPENAPRPKA
jgi:anti-sigma regulatory factor (Ser/Thr protein kinase)